METIYYVDSVGNSKDNKMETIYYVDSVGNGGDKKRWSSSDADKTRWRWSTTQIVQETVETEKDVNEKYVDVC